MLTHIFTGACAALLLLASTADAAPRTTPGAVSFRRLTHADREPGQWLSVGRTYDEQRFSPLKQINTSNVSRLGLAWFADLDSNRGQEATPLAIDGVLYLSTAWSRVKAFDARTGKLLWAYDPKVPGQFAGRGCCDVVNRGVAAWNGKIYVASYDGRLIALSAKTGKPVWEVLTVDHGKPVTSTGAPRIIRGGKVVIGNAGGELGVRGYISAYDAENGRLLWRFYTVPGNPADGTESAVMQKAAKTWNGKWWEVGGGAAVWDGIAYDPTLDLVYFGTGNGTPWNRAYRGSGGGDNLFVASILAVRGSDGRYVWHYQETPGEEWDYDATSPLMLADLPVEGRRRRVLMQAAKNGFFYVLDARTGKVISAHNFVPTTWATGVDASGRPLINPEARYDENHQVAIVQPGAQGAHSWHPFSYNPGTGLVYFSGIETSSAMKSAATYTPNPMGANVGLQSPLPPTIYDDLKSTAPRQARSRLIAWDPQTGKAAWRSEILGTIGSGTLSTAGGLVFQGTHKGRMVAYDASYGKELWSMEAQSGVVSAPSTFQVDGEQYLAQTVGYGLVPYGQSNHSRLLVLKLGGTAHLPPLPPPPPPPVLDPPPSTATAEVIEAGRKEFAGHCAVCHDTQYANRSVFPDLRYSSNIRTAEAFRAVVLEGVLQENGMAPFKGVVSPEAVEQIRAYLISRANEAKAAQARP